MKTIKTNQRYILGLIICLGIGFISATSRATVGANVQTREADHAQIANGAQDNAFERARHGRCSRRTMEGTHGYSYNGTVFGAGSIAAVGPITFDGEGHLSATYTVSLNGKPFEGAFTGTYTVDADCTGSVTLHLPLLGLTSKGNFVIVNQGRETFFTGTDPGVTITGVTKKF